MDPDQPHKTMHGQKTPLPGSKQSVVLISNLMTSYKGYFKYGKLGDGIRNRSTNVYGHLKKRLQEMRCVINKHMMWMTSNEKMHC